jgi:membrane-associated protease RseP (regulator of RpoE activity)
MVVGEVAPGSVAATSGLRAGDTVLQANGTIARSCSEWARAVVDAREGGKALLLLIARGDDEVALALGRRTWGGDVAAPTETPAAPPSRVARSEVPELPPPLPAEEAVSVDGVVTELGGLVGRTREGLRGYRDAVLHARRAVETLAARKLGSADTITGLRRVARLHEAAVLAWEGMDAIRERDGIARRLPVSDALTAPYFSGSPTQSVLDEFDFLHETVVEEPRPGRFTETSGDWRPAAARRIAWEHAGEELGRVASTLATTP